MATKDEKAKADTEDRVQPAERTTIGGSEGQIPGQDFKDAETARKAAADRSARGELGNPQDAIDPDDIAAETTEAIATRDNLEGPSDVSDKAMDRFLKLTGFDEDDVIGANADRRTFSTRQGGKYLLTKSGKQVRVISGPAYPKLREEAEEVE